MSACDPGPGPDPALLAERRYHDVCRAALGAMIEGADEQVVIGENASASGADAEVLGYELRSQAKGLRELPRAPLFFGRLDFAAGAGEHAGQSYHIGRLRISERPAAPPRVVDWRAPVSRAFYQAGAKDPQGVDTRRRFGWAPGSLGESADLTGFEDERLGAGQEHSGGSRILAGEIERPRVGPMRDIAATIQPDQDVLVREDADASICVQGAPGTGKTAVGLHRAAYLLYTFPQRVQRSGLLVLGPNRAFLTYISAVLPALGESGVRQSTVEEIVERGAATGSDAPDAEGVKHDVRMAEVLRRALYARVSTAGVREPLAVPDGSYRWRVPVDVLVRIVEGVLAEDPPYAVGRERVRSRVVRYVRERAERRAGAVGNAWVQRIGRARCVSAYVESVWPRVRAEEVLYGVLRDAGELARAADGVLSEAEQTAVVWARPARSYRSVRWSAADLVLLDEIGGLIEHPEGFGHIVVDEAQDLSPMQARVIARRAAFGSLTVLGDLAQGTTPWAARDWRTLLGHLGKPDAAVVPLTVGFRVPGVVLELAERVRERLDVAVPAARSLRADGEVRVERVERVAGDDGLGAGVVRAVRWALGREGSVGVIAAEGDVAGVAEALRGAGVGFGGVERLGERVTVLGAGVAKGLEYDHVVVVEPRAVVEGEPRGLERLYVVLTRAVSTLTLVHALPLPF